MTLRMTVLDERLAVCRLPVGTVLEPLLRDSGGSFFSITRTSDELSVVCTEEYAPEGATVEGGWRAIKAEGSLDFSLVGVLASISAPLADAGVPIFVVSTYDTDYVLVKEANLDEAVSALGGAGHALETHENTLDT